MNKAITLLLIVVGLINFLPIVGALSADRIAQAYAIEVSGRDLELLLRHRALLFGILGGFILYAAFRPDLQPAAMVMAGVSMAGFLLLAWPAADLNPALRRVLAVDLVGLLLLSAAAALQALKVARFQF